MVLVQKIIEIAAMHIFCKRVDYDLLKHMTRVFTIVKVTTYVGNLARLPLSLTAK